MMRVLFASDASPDAQVAADWLAQLPLPAAARALVLTVVDLPPAPLDVPPVVEFKRALLDEGRTTVGELLPLLRRRFGSVETRVAVGDARDEIVRVAREWAADLIVVGARGMGAVASALLGSVSLAVARHAPCAVLVVRPDPRPLRSVAVAIDGSPAAEEAAAFAGALPLPAAVAVRLIGVVEPPATPRTAPAAISGALQSAVALITADRRRALAEALERAAKSFAGPVRELPVGSPVETLERVSKEVDLIVLGARGLGALKRLLLGSVSEGVLRHAACPVLIVHSRSTD